MPAMSVAELNDFFRESFPGPPPFTVIEVTDNGVLMHLRFDTIQLRPGGTVSGPVLMSLADSAAYAAVLSRIGPVALAVTSTLTINFLRKPAPVDLWADAEILKLGRRQAVTDVRMRSEGSPDLVAQASVTYAIPSP